MFDLTRMNMRVFKKGIGTIAKWYDIKNKYIIFDSPP